MSAIGAFTFILQGHLPLLHPENKNIRYQDAEYLYKALAETWLPLLHKLQQLRDEQIPFKLTLALSTPLIEQMAHEQVLQNLDAYLSHCIEIASGDIEFFGAGKRLHGMEENDSAHLYYLAEWYQQRYETLQVFFQNQCQHDIIGMLRQYQDDGNLEIMGSAASHACLPLLASDLSIHAGIQAGIASYEHHFGRKPTAFWLPELAYRPALIDKHHRVRVGLERILAQYDFQVFVAETHAITGGKPVGIAGGEVIGQYGHIRRHTGMVADKNYLPKRASSPMTPHYVAEARTVGQHAGIAVIGRHDSTGQQIWNEDWGYPGDFDYREYDKQAGTSGLRYWRVTGARINLDNKDFYHPDWAAYKVEQHAEHFVHYAGDLLREHQERMQQPGIIAVCMDSRLFGQRWLEGIDWLGRTLTHFGQSPDIDLTTPAAFVEQHPPSEAIALPESSWGMGGKYFAWSNHKTDWQWAEIHRCELAMEELIKKYPAPTRTQTALLNYALQELLLLQSSDWLFWITTQYEAAYARERFRQHVTTFEQYASMLLKPDSIAAETVQNLENTRIFPQVDYRMFRIP